MASSARDLYSVLGVSADADRASIRKAYRSRAKAEHPDAGGSEQRFAMIKLAHDVLTDPERRKRYDETGEAEAKQPDNSMSGPIGHIAMALHMVLAKMTERGMAPDHIDIIADTRTTLRNKKKEVEDNAKNLVQARSIALTVQARLLGDDKTMRAILDNRVLQCDQMKVALTRQAAEMQAAIDLLKDCRYDFTDMSRDQFGGLTARAFLASFGGGLGTGF